MLKNSGPISSDVAAYMFGYYAVRCLESRNFWPELNQEHQLWAAFFDFAKEMREVQADLEYARNRLRL